MSSIPPQLTSALSEARGHLGLLAPVRLLRAVYNPFLDLVFPPRCAGCGRVDWHWCARCQAELDGEPFPAYVPPLPPLVGMAASAAHDGLVQRVIWSLKYENARAAALPLGQRLARRLALLRWPVDVIAPVPMHSSRLKARGYNQADLIAASALPPRRSAWGAKRASAMFRMPLLPMPHRYQGARCC
jgi:predicted amidophosphoribosyltransferase